MNGILILAHGSKQPETEDSLTLFIKQIKEKTGETLIQPAYLQFSEPDLQVGITRLVEKGAQCIKIIPLFLFASVHLQQDVPRQLDIVQRKYPQLSIKMSKHLGADERIIAILIDRIKSLD